MSKYKVGDKVILTVTGLNDKVYYPYYMFNDAKSNLWQSNVDKYAEPLSTYTEPLEDTIQKYKVKIARLVMEKERLKDENERLKAENEKMSIKIDAYELCSDPHEVEYNQAFNQGAETAWELARKIVDDVWNGGYSEGKLKQIFGYAISQLCIVKNTYSEAAAKVAEWEKAKEEIKAGDVVSREGLYGVVKSVSDDWLYGITASGISFQWLKRKCTKTGRHIDIDSFLKQIGGE